MVDKRPDQFANTRTDVRGEKIHSSDGAKVPPSSGTLAEDVSRTQSAANPYSDSLTYDLGDLVEESGTVFRNIVAITVPETFNPTKWDAVGAAGAVSLQDAYDNGNEIKEDDPDGLQTNTPIKITVADPPVANKGEYAESGESYIVGDIVTLTGPLVSIQFFRNIVAIADPAGVFDSTKWVEITIFQSVQEVIDLNSKAPITFQGGGQIKQIPFNLELVKTINDGDDSINLGTPKTFEAHSRFVFIGNTTGVNAGIEILSLRNPEIPEHIHTIKTSDGFSVTLPIDVRHHGSYLYVLSDEGGTGIVFSIIDVSNPNTPIELATLVVGGVGDIFEQLLVVDKHVYIRERGPVAVGSGSIIVLDVSDFDNILTLATWTNGLDNGNGPIQISTPQQMAIHEKKMWITNFEDGIVLSNAELIDITDPALPLHISNIVEGAGLTPPHLKNVRSIIPTRDIVYFLSESELALTIIDYVDPTTPVVRGVIRDPPDLGLVMGGILEGQYLYVHYFLSGESFVASFNVDDPDNPFKLGEVITSTEALIDSTAMTIRGNHIYLLHDAVAGRLFILRSSGLDTQAARISSALIGNLEVKGEVSSRRLDVSEDGHFGQGILVNGVIAGQKGSQIKKRVINLTVSGAGGTVDFDMSFDDTIFIVDAIGLTGDVDANVINGRQGNRATIIAQFDAPVHADSINFDDAQFYIPELFPDFLGFLREVAELQVLEEGGGPGTILAKCWKDGNP